MARDRRNPAHAVRPEPLTQGIDQGGAALNALVIRNGTPEVRLERGRRGADELREMADIKFSLIRRHRFGAGDGKSDGLKTEAGLIHGGLGFEFEIEQARHVSDVACR